MHASWAPVAAEDCVLKPLQPINKVIVNSSSCFELSTADAGTTGRVFDGTEDVIAFVTGQWFVNMCMQAAACRTWRHLDSASLWRLVFMLSSVLLFRTAYHQDTLQA